MVVDFADLSNKHCCILGEEWILEIVDWYTMLQKFSISTSKV